MHATLQVSLKLPEGQGKLELAAGTQPGLYVVSGPPARMEVEMAW
jgi:hypothetical protein